MIAKIILWTAISQDFNNMHIMGLTIPDTTDIRLLFPSYNTLMDVSDSGDRSLMFFTKGF